MINSLKIKYNNFINSSKDYPVLVGFLAGFYPFLFYFSNNFELVNSWQHFAFFSFWFIVLPIVLSFFGYLFFSKIKSLQKHKQKFLFVFLLQVASVLMCFAYYVGFRRKLLFAFFIMVIFLSLKNAFQYKKILVLIAFVSIFPFTKLFFAAYNQYKPSALAWTKQNDDIEKVQFKTHPNIYFIEPDGYVGQKMMSQKPYSHKNPMYDWLTNSGFSLYDSNSNYPASLASNASMFAMKHHYLESIPASPFEMNNSRKVIVGNNPVVDIFKNNGYKTYFIAEDEYFQQNFSTGKYDFYNIKNAEIPYFVNATNFVKKEVYSDFKNVLETENSKKPKFFFIEKLLPHHIHFDGTGKENERKVYLKKIEEVNIWLKNITEFINKKDPNAIIIIAADHGGWVGLETVHEMFSTQNPVLIASVYNNLLAIKWNSNLHSEYDSELKSNVNIFRILFSYLSQDKKYLENLEENSSYRIMNDGFFGRKSVKVAN